MCTDDIAAKAAHLLATVGKADWLVGVSDTLNTDGSHLYFVTATPPEPGTGLGSAIGMAVSPAGVLADFAKSLGAAWPVVYASGEQRETIIRLLNDPRINTWEKHNGLLNINRYTAATADELIDGLKRDINARAGHVVWPEVVEYAVVVGSAEILAPAA